MFWQRFEALCAGINKSPNAVAAELDFSNSATTSWKKGAIPRANNLQKLAQYFGITVSEMLGETKSPAPNKGEANRAEFIRLYEAAPAWLQDEVRSLLKAAESSRAIQDGDPTDQ